MDIWQQWLSSFNSSVFYGLHKRATTIPCTTIGHGFSWTFRRIGLHTVATHSTLNTKVPPVMIRAGDVAEFGAAANCPFYIYTLCVCVCVCVYTYGVSVCVCISEHVCMTWRHQRLWQQSNPSRDVIIYLMTATFFSSNDRLSVLSILSLSLSLSFFSRSFSLFSCRQKEKLSQRNSRRRCHPRFRCAAIVASNMVRKSSDNNA